METTRIDGEAGNGKAGTRSTATDAEDAAFDIVALVGLAAAVLLLGYACPCVGAALALAPRLGLPVAFVVVGGVHVLGAAVALAVVLARDAPPPFDGSFSELDRTVASLAPKPKPEPKIDGARQLAQQPASERIIPRGTA